MSPRIQPVRHSHAYTSSPLDWYVSEPRHDITATAGGYTFGYRLFRYLTTGGVMPQIGRTGAQELMRRRQKRFLVAAAVVAALWTLAIFI